jgi:hypothetical protein
MKMTKILRAVVSLLSLSLLLPTAGATRQDKDAIKVPLDLTLRLELLSELNSESSKKGDKFTCKVLSLGDYEKAVVTGNISGIRSRGEKDKITEISLVFDTITLADGRTGKFSCRIVEVLDPPPVADDLLVARSPRKRDTLKPTARSSAGGILGGFSGIGGVGRGSLTNVLSEAGPGIKLDKGTLFDVLTVAPR